MQNLTVIKNEIRISLDTVSIGSMRFFKAPFDQNFDVKFFPDVFMCLMSRAKLDVKGGHYIAMHILE